MAQVTLKTGLTVVNFSSPHAFTFSDGSVLPACSPEHCRELSLTRSEVSSLVEVRGVSIREVKVSFVMTPQVREELDRLQNEEVDIIIVPLPILQLVREERAKYSKVRGVLLADRVNKICEAEAFSV
jgi:hypothetical protein